MKVNNITATDYRESNGTLIVFFVNTASAEVEALDSSVLTVSTDDGDEVISFRDYVLRAYTVTTDASGSVTAEYTHVNDNGVNARLTALEAEDDGHGQRITALEAENEMMAEVLDALLMGDLEV